MAEEEGGSDSSDNSSVESKPCSSDSSCNDHPHFQLMKAVLKKHLSNEPKDCSFGFYCNVCKAFSVDEKLWNMHLSRPSHCNRIDSPEFLRKNTLYKCGACNIELICDTEFFSWHNQTDAHRAIFKNLKKRHIVEDQSNSKCQSQQVIPKEKSKKTQPKSIVKNGICLKGKTLIDQ